ncbi:MAG: hypothetical protein AAF125_06545 [Chloroflexota bacterium]
MYFEFADRQFWDTVIFIVFGIGVLAAAYRLYTDFTRPLPPDRSRSTNADDDTRPHPPHEDT